MSNPRSELEAFNRETDALAERLERRIHAIAFVLTAVVLAMRLVAGRQDLESSWDETAADPPAAETAPLPLQ